MLTFLSLVIGTFVSEDLSCVTAGLLIQRGEISAAAAVVASIVGIFLGDLGLWGIGRIFGRASLAWTWMRLGPGKIVPSETAPWLQRNAPSAILASRFLPGTRLPLYLMAGALGIRGRVFASWSLVATLVWTSPIVLLTAAAGGGFVDRLRSWIAIPWLPLLLAATVVLSIMHFVRTTITRVRWHHLAARIARWSRWEFWPMWLFYGPVAVWVLMLAIRHRGLSTITAANPGMPDGGTVGESKFDILRRLPAESVVPAFLTARGAIELRLSAIRDHVAASGWIFPIILKPDVGQRGTGVRLARSWEDVRRYLSHADTPIIVQPFHRGPYEAGIFYYRLPGSPRGRILSITDKRFPVVVGDGQSTLEQLIWRHPRFRMQAGTFLARHRASLARVLEEGETFQLAIAGNHAQGTLFLDGAHLITPQLEQRIDEVAQAYPGFFVGRFDVRYSDVQAFKRGRDLAIVELNGATSETTNIYDPCNSLLGAYRQLFRQWSIVFAVGAANRARGERTTSHRRLLQLVGAHLKSACAFPISD